MRLETGLKNDLAALEASLRQLFRWGNLPRLRERLVARRGIQLDRASYSLIVPLEKGSVRISELARQAGVDVSTASRQIVELEREGVVRRLADPEDGRASNLELTSMGRRHLTKLSAARQEMLSEILHDFTEDEIAHLAYLLDHLNRSIASYIDIDR